MLKSKEAPLNPSLQSNSGTFFTSRSLDQIKAESEAAEQRAQVHTNMCEDFDQLQSAAETIKAHIQSLPEYQERLENILKMQADLKGVVETSQGDETERARMQAALENNIKSETQIYQLNESLIQIVPSKANGTLFKAQDNLENSLINSKKNPQNLALARQTATHLHKVASSARTIAPNTLSTQEAKYLYYTLQDSLQAARQYIQDYEAATDSTSSSHTSSGSASPTSSASR